MWSRCVNFDNRGRRFDNRGWLGCRLNCRRCLGDWFDGNRRLEFSDRFAHCLRCWLNCGSRLGNLLGRNLLRSHLLGRGRFCRRLFRCGLLRRRLLLSGLLFWLRLTGQAIAICTTSHHVGVGLVKRGRLALDGHAEGVAQVDGLGIGHAKFLRQFGHLDLFCHLTHQPFVVRPSLTDDSLGHTATRRSRRSCTSASDTG